MSTGGGGPGESQRENTVASQGAVITWFENASHGLFHRQAEARVLFFSLSQPVEPYIDDGAAASVGGHVQVRVAGRREQHDPLPPGHLNEAVVHHIKMRPK